MGDAPVQADALLGVWATLLVTTPVLAPLLGAGATALAWGRLGAQRLLCGLAVGLMALGGVALLVGVLGQGPIAIGFGGWRPPFGIAFLADPLSAALTVTTGLVAAAVLLYGRAELRPRQERAGFHPLFLGMLAGVNGAFLTADLFNLYVWFEMMLVAAMGLLLLDRRPAQVEGALRYAAMNILGTVLFLIGIALLFGVTGTLTMADLGRVVPGLPPSAALAVAACLFLAGFGIKAGFFPLFAWLPASYPTAGITAVAAMAGLLTKVGFYAALRVFTLILPPGEGWMGTLLLLLLAVATMVTGLLAAVAQWDLRRLLAFNIVGGVGTMLVGLALGTEAGLSGAVFYMLHHIVVMAGLFLAAGAICRGCGSFDLQRCGGLMYGRPAFALIFAPLALSLAGLPPFSGFWAKLLVVDAALRQGHVLLAGVVLWVGLLTLLSMARVWMEAFWKDLPGPRAAPQPLPGTMLAAIGFLSALTLLMGLFAEPMTLLSRDAAAHLVAPARAGALILGGAP
ncbi:Na+/H+ antiporter subunit D [Roseomonas sp. OT10]|uniref:proton-conducting transporter transmembrane domain-containing protein n=1 Tax=Roseomonas cutis TaxID=2897332 RepID=UPI001E35F05E|nr:proton-conducting transporter membrane subunit [Roseomonas sp. OT10]UFN47923.1 Na+/H+ antiporter subunit D [Roseomonas sp. OT10]